MSCKAAESHEVAVLRMARVNCNLFCQFMDDYQLSYFTIWQLCQYMRKNVAIEIEWIKFYNS